MTIIYQPGEVVNLRKELFGGFVGAVTAAAVDFIAGNNKPWTYYLGVGLGTAAYATGIPGFTATIYAVGDTVDAIFFKSPDGSDVRVFLNGVAHSTIDTYAAAAVWEAINFNGLVGGQVNRLDIVNYGPSPNGNATGIPWLALGPITVNGVGAYAQGATMAYNTIAYRIRDDEADTSEDTLAVYAPAGLTLAQYQAFADFQAPLVDALTEGQITAVQLNITLTLPGGLKATPVAGALNERGGLITFDTTGPRADSVRIPAMSRTIMPGDSFSLEDNDVSALINSLLTVHAGSTVRPRTTQDYQFVAARKAKKSFRK